MSGATETREIARKALVSCAECGKATPGAGNSDLCDACYSGAEAFKCRCCEQVVVEDENDLCAECYAGRAEYRCEEYRTERAAGLFNDDGCRTPEGCER